MEIRNEKMIIYKDSPITGVRIVGFFFFLSLFIIVTIWIIGLLSEMYWENEDDLLFLCLLILAATSFWRIVRIIQKMIDVENKKPLVVIDKAGIKYFNNKFLQWNEIRKINLCIDFDKKYIGFVMMNNQKLIYEIDDLEVSDFMMLSKFRDHLKIFFENVELNES